MQFKKSIYKSLFLLSACNFFPWQSLAAPFDTSDLPKVDKDDKTDASELPPDPTEFSGVILQYIPETNKIRPIIITYSDEELKALSQILDKDFYWAESDLPAMRDAAKKALEHEKVKSFDDAGNVYRKLFWTILAPKVKLRDASTPKSSSDISEELLQMVADAFHKQVKVSDFPKTLEGFVQKNNFLGAATLLESRRFATLCGMGCMLHEREGVSNDGWVLITLKRAFEAMEKAEDGKVSAEIFQSRLQQRIDHQNEVDAGEEKLWKADEEKAKAEAAAKDQPQNGAPKEQPKGQEQK